MNTDYNLRRDDYEKFLIIAYFGTKGNYLERCINRAYLDFARTLTKIDKLPSKEPLKELANTFLLSAVCVAKTRTTEIDYDNWHFSTCQELSRIYKEHGYPDFYVGQAQKWINMTFKYIFTMGNQRISGYESLYPYCHVPLDSIVIERSQKYNPPPLNCAWSRINDYQQYLDYQNWFRRTFKFAPLDVELWLWNGQKVDLK